jgi:Tol biopolymer transport system component/DNA-binding winged helix-turn-helix (wHTH) protein
LETTNGSKNGALTNGHRFTFDNFEIDPANRILLREGEVVPLTGRIFDVLLVFVENPGRLLEKDELIEKVWHADFVEEGNLARNVSTLRKALGDTGKEHKYIATVPGHGYRFISDVIVENGDTCQLTEHRTPEFRHPIAEPSDLRRRDKTARADQIGKHLSERPWFFAIAGLCLIGIAAVAFRFGDFRSRQKDQFSFDRLHQTKLTRDGHVYGGVISPDGQYLAYTNISGNLRALCLRQVATGSVLEMRPPEAGISYWAATFAPDNSFLYYILKEKDADYGNVYRIPLLGGQPPYKLAQHANGGLTVSSDGQKVAFTRIDRQAGTSSIVVIDRDGTSEQIVGTVNLDSLFYSLDWSPDGNHLVYSIKRHDADHDYWYLAEIPSVGGDERRIGDISDLTILMAKWMPDQSGLIVNAIDEATRQAQLYAVSYPDGARHRITNDLNSYAGFSTTRDGRSIVVPEMTSNRQIWTVDGGAATQISSGTEKHFDSIAWAGSNFVVFDEDENGSFDKYNIYRMQPDGADVQQLTFGSGNNTSPVVSPDGGTIVFVSDRSGKSQVWRMNLDGKNLTQLTDVGNNVIRPVFSANGREIFFSVSAAGKCNIWKVSANGGPASAVIDADVYRWALSPDGERLAYSAYDNAAKAVRTFVRSLRQRDPGIILDISPETWMEWSGDGKALYFDTAQDGAQNIWRQDLDGSRARPQTNFNTEQVFRFAWSLDGKHLACIRHTTTFDAVMLRFD